MTLELKNFINAELIFQIKKSLDSLDTVEMYEEMIDDCYNFDSVGGPFTYLLPSIVLKECDGPMYDQGLCDYEDSLLDDGDYQMISGYIYLADDIEEFFEELKWEAEAQEDKNFIYDPSNSIDFSKTEYDFKASELAEFLDDNDWSNFQ